MWIMLYRLFDRIATWPMVALLFSIFVLCSGGFNWRSKRLGCENPVLDARFWYSPGQARDFFKAIDKEGRRIYAISQVTLDLVFPLTYGALFGALIVHVYAQNIARLLVWVPVLTAITDLLENVTTAFLAWQFDDRASPLAWVAAVFTAVKTVLFGVGLVLIVLGAIRLIGH